MKEVNWHLKILEAKENFREGYGLKNCKCENVKLVHKIDKINRKWFHFQCEECGKTKWDSKALTRETKEMLDKIPLWDEKKHDGYWKQKRKDLEKFSIESRRIFFEVYNEYLSSQAWKVKRDIIFKRCKHVCEGCGRLGVQHVHHLTYDNVGDELLFQLVGLCYPCHSKLHGDIISSFSPTGDEIIEKMDNNFISNQIKETK